MNSRPFGPTGLARRLRRAAASAIASGRWTRISTISARGLAAIGHLCEQPLDLRRHGHGVRAGDLRGDDRAGGVGEPERAVQRPPGQQAVAERTAEGVAGTEPVHDLDPDCRYLDQPVRIEGKHPVGPSFDHGQRYTGIQRGLCGRLRVAYADGGVELVDVSDHDSDVTHRLLYVPAGVLARGPERRPVV